MLSTNSNFKDNLDIDTDACLPSQIAGTLGTGLFLGSGKALREAGPLGALIGYALVGTVAYSYALSSYEDPGVHVLTPHVHVLQIAVLNR